MSVRVVLALLEASAKLKGEEEQFQRIVQESQECR